MTNHQTPEHDDRDRQDHPVDSLLTAALTIEPLLSAVEERLLARVDGFTPRSHRWRWPVTISGAVAAVLVAAAVTGFLLMGGAEQSLYAQVLAATENAKTIHAVMKRYTGEKAEIWYDRDQGMRTSIHRDREESITLNDRTHEWIYQSSTNTVLKRPTYDVSQNLQGLLNPLSVLKNAERDASDDQPIDGVMCRLYVAAADGADVRNRVWIDHGNRMRRLELQVLRDGRWHEDEVVEVRYDTPIYQAIFKPDFPADAKVVIQGDLLDGELALDRALFTHRALGLIFAVHDVLRVDDDMVLVVHTVRPDESTTRQFGPIDSRYDGSNYYGNCNLDTAFQWVDEVKKTWRSYQPLTLAHATYDGIDISWTLLIEQGIWPEQKDEVDIGVDLYARGELQQWLTGRSQGWFENFKHLVQLPLNQNRSLTQALSDVHAQAMSIEARGPVYGAVVTRNSRPFTQEERQRELERGTSVEDVELMSVQPQVPPSTISPAEFETEVRAHIEKLRKLQ
jgi:outer membrane lipoprotein-sorting protein